MIIGVTSSMGCGSSTVAKMLQKFGASLISADDIAQKVLESAAVKKQLIKTFGHIILKGKKIDRKRLAHMAFKNETETKKLNEITHPVIIKKIESKIKRLKKKNKKKPIVIDAALLFETGLNNLTDRVIVVTASREKQLRRLQDKGFTEKEALQRIKAQLPLSRKTTQADYVIDNNGALKITQAKVKTLWQTLTR